MIGSINIGRDFSRYPAGRYPADGKYNGQTFRRKHLVPALQRFDKVDIFLDDAVDYGSSFLEEAFGGLVRVEHIDKSIILTKLDLHSDFSYLIAEIREYIKDAVFE